MELIITPRQDLERFIEDAITRAASRPPEGSGAELRPAKGWLTNSEAQEYLGLSRATLARYRSEGLLPYSKVGRNLFYRLSDVEALLEANRRYPDA